MKIIQYGCYGDLNDDAHFNFRSMDDDGITYLNSREKGFFNDEDTFIGIL
jgi:hypothetical protein